MAAPTSATRSATRWLHHYEGLHLSSRVSARVAIERGRTNVAEPWLSADDIAAHLGVTKDTVYTWIAEKAMPAHKVGRLWKFQASEIDDWVRRGGAAADSDPPPPG